MSTPPSTSQTSKDVHLSGLTPSPPTRPVRSSKRRSPGSGGAGVLGLTPGDDGSRAFTSATIPVSDQALLSFYGLTTLEPTVWFDLDPVLPQTPSTSSLQPSSPSSIPKSSSSSSLFHPPSNGGATSTTPMTPSSSSSSSTLNEGLDPLGFKANIFQHLSPSHLTPHRAQLSIVSKDFQPRLFLALVHPNLTYSQFQEGLKKLGNQGEQHHAWLRTLVRENFYPHVVAKTTVDTVFQTMTTQQDLHVDFAVPFMETLDIGVTTAQQVFGPMLLKRKHMESLKATLLVLDRFKFFFKLPNVLHLAVQQGHVESAVREFKKGKALVLAMYPSLVLSTTNASANASASANPPTSTSTSGSMSNSGGGGGVLDEVKSEHHKKLFEKIWTRVTHVMQLVKEQLIKQLHEHECALEIQEQAIRLILEVDPNADPFWTYLESRHRWILAQLKEKVSMHFRAITNNDTNDQQPLVKFTPNQFRKALFLRNKKEFETIFAKDLEVQAWQCVTQLVRILTESLVSMVPDFSKMVFTYTNKSTSMNPTPSTLDPKRLDQCLQMPLDIVKYWATLLKHACHLKLQDGFPVFPKLTHMNALTVAHFAPKFTHMLVNAMDQLHGSSEIILEVSSVLTEIQDMWMSLLLSAWRKDASSFSSLEDAPSTNQQTGSTFLNLYSTYTKCMLQSAFKLWHLRKDNSTMTFAEFIYPSFFEAHQLFFQSLVAPSSSSTLPSDRSTLILVSQLDQGYQLAESWVTYLTNLSGPTLATLTSSLFTYIQSLKQDVLRSFVRRQINLLEPILVANVGPQPQFRITRPPSAVRPWVYQVMQHLNGLHVLLCTWLPNLVRDVLSQVISALAQSILSLLRSIEQIDTHGRDQLGLELTFLQHSLQTFTSSSLNKVFEAIQNEVLADASPYLQDLLDQALQTTRMQFYGLAYQPPQTS